MAEKFVLRIWTDGSHIKGTTIMGYGAFAKYADVTAELTCRVRGGEGFSNPTLELLAAWRVVRILLARGTPMLPSGVSSPVPDVTTGEASVRP
jgi:hypothetical protein